MSTLTRRAHRQPFADVFGWLEGPLGLIRPAAGHPMRVEDYVKNGRYVLRAEPRRSRGGLKRSGTRPTQLPHHGDDVFILSRFPD